LRHELVQHSIGTPRPDSFSSCCKRPGSHEGGAEYW
jgi:hypothetical protein